MFEEPSCLVYSVLGTKAGALCSLGKHSVNLQSSFTFSFESFCQIPVKILARITLYCSLFLIKLESCSFTCFCPGTSLMLRFWSSIPYCLRLPTRYFIKDTCCHISSISSICTNSINFEFMSFLFFQLFELTIQSPFLQYLSSKGIRGRHCPLKAAVAAALGSDTVSLFADGIFTFQLH